MCIVDHIICETDLGLRHTILLACNLHFNQGELLFLRTLHIENAKNRRQFTSVWFANMNHTENTCARRHTSLCLCIKHRQILVYGVWYTNCMQMVPHMFVVPFTYTHIWYANHMRTEQHASVNCGLQSTHQTSSLCRYNTMLRYMSVPAFKFQYRIWI